MLRGYIRKTGTVLSIKAQKEALMAVGITDMREYGPVYIDDRDAAIQSLCPGDQLVVASPSCLGVSVADIMSVLEQIGAREATVLRADENTEIAWGAETQNVLKFANEAESTRRKEAWKKAQRSKAKTGHYGGKPRFEVTPEVLKKLQKMLSEKKLTNDEIATELGTSRPTLQRKLKELRAAGKLNE